MFVVPSNVACPPRNNTRISTLPSTGTHSPHAFLWSYTHTHRLPGKSTPSILSLFWQPPWFSPDSLSWRLCSSVHRHRDLREEAEGAGSVSGKPHRATLHWGAGVQSCVPRVGPQRQLRAEAPSEGMNSRGRSSQGPARSHLPGPSCLSGSKDSRGCLPRVLGS